MNQRICRQLEDPQPIAEFRAICRMRANVLLEGPPDVTARAVQRFLPYLSLPIERHAAGEALEFAIGRCPDTLIIEDVAALKPSEQALLRGWLTHAAGRMQVVSVSRRPLFSLVGRRLFDDALYYHLNVVRLSDPQQLQDAALHR